MARFGVRNCGFFHDVVACLVDSMFVWPITGCCKNSFLGISYATIGLDNQVVFAHSGLTYLVLVIY